LLWPVLIAQQLPDRRRDEVRRGLSFGPSSSVVGQFIDAAKPSLDAVYAILGHMSAPATAVAGWKERGPPKFLVRDDSNRDAYAGILEGHQPFPKDMREIRARYFDLCHWSGHVHVSNILRYSKLINTYKPDRLASRNRRWGTARHRRTKGSSQKQTTPACMS
jgi:hypothetical protein